ncbi:cytochrome P450 [Nocardia blacklockiae]|nr:cytochrome P450 [Nocardia blacklockiae]
MSADDRVVLPPGPRLPRWVQGAAAVVDRRGGLRLLHQVYGPEYTLHLPIFGPTVAVSDPELVRQVFKAPAGMLENVEQNLGRVMGPDSMFALTGERHRAHRKLLAPPFHGRRLGRYDTVMELEAQREFARVPVGTVTAMLPSMMRITLNIILRAVFGAQGRHFERLQVLLPRMVELGAQLALIPVPQWDWGRWSPWGRFLGYRREYDAIVGELVEAARTDPALDEREDILALMVQSRYDDGAQMTIGEIADELVALLTAGHETTATTLAWAVERLQRHPAVLERLVADLDDGDEQSLMAVITEVQRCRPVIDSVFRQVAAPRFELGPWVLPRGQVILVSIGLLHANPQVFPDPDRFDPERFLRARRDINTWIPFGGGNRRCLGAAFAELEMRVVLRTLLREFTLTPRAVPDERWHSRGVAFAPARGGQAVLTPRR